MAYHLTGTKTLLAAIAKKLSPVKGGLHYIAQHELFIADALENLVVVPIHTHYHITGTADGNGYVVTFSDPLGSTHYFEAEVGCKLC
jgi:hypothetical protein